MVTSDGIVSSHPFTGSSVPHSSKGDEYKTIDSSKPTINTASNPNEYCRALSDRELRELLREIRVINNMEAPSKHNSSRHMKALYRLVTTGEYHKFWHQLTSAQTSIRNEILWRVENGTWNLK